MNVQIPRGVVIGATVVFGLASLLVLLQQSPEAWRYLKVEGM